LSSISLIGQRDVERKISETYGVALMHGVVSIAVSAVSPNRWGRPSPVGYPGARLCPFSASWSWLSGAGSNSLLEICELIAHNEFKDATTAVDLALWKARIEEEKAWGPASREACRIEVPGPARDTIVSFLKDGECLGDIPNIVDCSVEEDTGPLTDDD